MVLAIANRRFFRDPDLFAIDFHRNFLGYLFQECLGAVSVVSTSGSKCVPYCDLDTRLNTRNLSIVMVLTSPDFGGNIVMGHGSLETALPNVTLCTDTSKGYVKVGKFGSKNDLIHGLVDVLVSSNVNNMV